MGCLQSHGVMAGISPAGQRPARRTGGGLLEDRRARGADAVAAVRGVALREGAPVQRRRRRVLLCVRRADEGLCPVGTKLAAAADWIIFIPIAFMPPLLSCPPTSGDDKGDDKFQTFHGQATSVRQTISPSVTALKTLHHALTPHRAQQRWLDNGTDNGIVLVPQRLRLVRLVERQNAAPPLPRRLCCAD